MTLRMALLRRLDADVAGTNVPAPVTPVRPLSPASVPCQKLSLRMQCAWKIELDIRAIKSTLNMDVLRGKSPHMVRREMWTGFLAYNLIRRLMLQSALASGRLPRQLSFAATLQSLGTTWLSVITAPEDLAARLAQAGLENVGSHTVGDRPGRVEPRAVKRRPKQHALLTKPRAEARAELLEGKAA